MSRVVFPSASILFFGAIAAACGEIRESSPAASAEVDGGASSSSSSSSSGGSTLDGNDGSTSSSSSSSSGEGDSGVAPSAACRKIPLDCLDSSAANVIEVPTEVASLSDAFTQAKTNDVVQVKGRAIGAGFRVPAYVTLRGCDGASITGNIGFAGNGGTVEGFTVSGAGTIIANQTGTYVVRYNRFLTTTSNEPGVSGRSVDALVSANVILNVDSNVFEGPRPYGVAASTSYDTMTHAVDIVVKNNVFTHVTRPFTVSEGGLVGVINAKIEHNTFYDFDTAILFTAMDRKATTSGNLFVNGKKGIEGNTYDVAYSFAWQVQTPSATPPLSGSIATADPAFVDANAGDFRLGPASAVLNRIPSSTQVPAEDYQGCPRPAGGAADVGAYESQ